MSTDTYEFLDAVTGETVLTIETPKPAAPRQRMVIDAPVTDARIGSIYRDRKLRGIIADIKPLGRRDRTHVEFVVKYPNKGDQDTVKHYRHETCGTFETEA